MNKYYRILSRIAVLFLPLLLSACIATEPWYDSKFRDWKQNRPDEKAEIEHRIFLLGDTGAPVIKGPDPTLSFLKNMISQTNAPHTVIFLGDNIYPNGIEPKTKPSARKRSEARLNKNLQALDKSTGNTFFVPGNHDWYSGWAGLAAQDSIINKYNNPGEVKLLPSPGCPGPIAYELNDEIVSVFIDSQWFLFKDHRQIATEHQCSNKTIEEVKNELKMLADRHRDKILLLAAHHPFYANANHGGNFPLKDHLFPLTNVHPALYLPLPIVGSVYPLIRNFGVSKQDISNRTNKKYQRAVIEALSGHENVIIASGHEHILQYTEINNRHFIISGSGSKKKKPHKGKKAEFVSPDLGFVTIDYYKNGTAWAYFWSTENKHRNDNPIFRVKLLE